jgi:hypothetical protein
LVSQQVARTEDERAHIGWYRCTINLSLHQRMGSRVGHPIMEWVLTRVDGGELVAVVSWLDLGVTASSGGLPVYIFQQP